MPLNPNISILDVITMAFSPQVNAYKTLNPVHLTFATKGYWIQSHILCIPDRYGFFSPGPPRLQVHQGFLSNVLLLMIVCDIFFGLATVFWMSSKPDHKPIWKVVVFMVAVVGGVVATIWVMECYGKRRAPNYEWDDWKQRND
jgi:hypothetical protein